MLALRRLDDGSPRFRLCLHAWVDVRALLSRRYEAALSASPLSTTIPTATRMNLELIETKVLVDELLRRFEHAIFAGLKVNEASETQYETHQRVGNQRTCQGLAFGIIARCEDYRRSVSEPTVGDS